MPSLRAVARLLVPLALTGCTVVGPDFATPQIRISDQWQDADAMGAAATADASTTWWTAFNDPVLDTLIADAYANNLRLEIAGLRVYEARATLARVMGGAYPQVQLARAGAATVHRSEHADPVSTLPGPVADATETEFDLYGFGVDASWELDLWGRHRRSVEAADAHLAGVIASYDDVLVSLTGDVAAAYVLLRTLQERLAFAQSNIGLQKRGLVIAQTRFRNGTRTELDVQQALSLLNATQARIPQLEADIRRTMNALSTLLARPPGELNAILGGIGVIPAGPDRIDVGVPADLLRRRPDVRQAAQAAASQCARIGIAEADLYPAFRLAGSVGYAADSTGDLFDGDSFNGVGSFTVLWKFLNYGRLKNDVRIQDSRFQQRLAAYQLTVLSAAQEVEDALTGYLKARAEVSFREAGSAASQRAADLALAQYSNGATSYGTVLDTQRQLGRDQDLLTQARGRVARSLIAAYKASGGGWQLRLGKPFVDDAVRDEMRRRTNWGPLLESRAPTAGAEASSAGPDTGS